VFCPIVGTRSVAASFSESHACQPFAVESADVFVDRDVGPVSPEDFPGVGVGFALADDSMSGPFESEVEASDSGEEGDDIHAALRRTRDPSAS
jgi:hypothetical protein